MCPHRLMYWHRGCLWWGTKKESVCMCGAGDRGDITPAYSQPIVSVNLKIEVFKICSISSEKDKTV